jgi:hypothetical protein
VNRLVRGGSSQLERTTGGHSRLLRLCRKWTAASEERGRLTLAFSGLPPVTQPSDAGVLRIVWRRLARVHNELSMLT